jgi:hypothetical protein
MPVVWRAAPFAAPLAGTTEPRRSWLPSAAGHKTSVECIKRLQAGTCSRPLEHPGSTLSMTPFGKHEAPGRPREKKRCSEALFFCSPSRQCSSLLSRLVGWLSTV